MIIGNARLIQGDCIEAMRAMPAASVDSVVCDPPYELGFMGKGWDNTGIAFDPDTWRECLRVLKPGGHLVAFNHSRTWHRMAVAIEDAGFEIRDTLMWLYASGFPKSLDVSKAIDKMAGAEREVIAEYSDNNRKSPKHQNTHGAWNGDAMVQITAPATDAARQWQGWGSALKPAHEPILLARKPLTGTIAANVLAHGTGALNIDGTRIAATGGENFARPAVHNGEHEGWDRPWKHTVDGQQRRQASKDEAAAKAGTLGRFPANLLHDGSPEVLAAFAAFGEKKSPATYTRGDHAEGEWLHAKPAGSVQVGFGDTGTAARFFFSGKATAEDRADSKHPTVKPIALMRWLVRLVTPPNGVCLDPFSGSGTTGAAALREGFHFVGIEREAEYFADCVRRMEAETEQGSLFEAAE